MWVPLLNLLQLTQVDVVDIDDWKISDISFRISFLLPDLLALCIALRTGCHLCEHVGIIVDFWFSIRVRTACGRLVVVSNLLR